VKPTQNARFPWRVKHVRVIDADCHLNEVDIVSATGEVIIFGGPAILLEGDADLIVRAVNSLALVEGK
jgi:hypothetical protein